MTGSTSTKVDLQAFSRLNEPMLLRVGQDSLRGGDIARYASRFDLLELNAERGQIPRLATLHRWREQVPRQLVFSVTLGSRVGRLDDGVELESDLESALRAVQVLAARWVVLQTGPTVTPSQRNRRRLEAVVARLPRESCRLAWEPRGLWEPEQQEEVCASLGMTLVRDLRRCELPRGPVAYTRLRALGAGARFSTEAAEVVAERAAGLDELYVVIEGQGARNGAEVLRRLLIGEVSQPNLVD